MNYAKSIVVTDPIYEDISKYAIKHMLDNADDATKKTILKYIETPDAIFVKHSFGGAINIKHEQQIYQKCIHAIARICPDVQFCKMIGAGTFMYPRRTIIPKNEVATIGGVQKWIQTSTLRVSASTKSRISNPTKFDMKPVSTVIEPFDLTNELHAELYKASGEDLAYEDCCVHVDVYSIEYIIMPRYQFPAICQEAYLVNISRTMRDLFLTRMTISLLQQLQCYHHYNIIHQNITAGNIMMRTSTEPSSAMVIDFDIVWHDKQLMPYWELQSVAAKYLKSLLDVKQKEGATDNIEITVDPNTPEGKAVIDCLTYQHKKQFICYANNGSPMSIPYSSSMGLVTSQLGDIESLGYTIGEYISDLPWQGANTAQQVNEIPYTKMWYMAHTQAHLHECRDLSECQFPLKHLQGILFNECYDATYTVVDYPTLIANVEAIHTMLMDRCDFEQSSGKHIIYNPAETIVKEKETLNKILQSVNPTAVTIKKPVSAADKNSNKIPSESMYIAPDDRAQLWTHNIKTKRMNQVCQTFMTQQVKDICNPGNHITIGEQVSKAKSIPKIKSKKPSITKPST